jgi:SAM-dependent methyltransferase
MPEHEFGGATSFKELERQGWGAKAGNYDALGGQITVGAVGPLLDAAGVRTGMRVLDVAAGPGYVAAGADARGAHAVGIDFAADMVSEARRRYPNIEFHEGDAENLAFDTSSFDAVVCAFGFSTWQTRIRRLQRRIGCSVQMGGLHSRSGRGPTGMIFLRLC